MITFLKTRRRPAPAIVAVLACASWATTMPAQPPGNSAQVQRDALQKLAFLAGRWVGPVTIMRGPGEPLHLTQTENVEFKLDGLVLQVEGQSTGADSKPQFQALATIAYDDSAHAYRIRAYNDGHYLDTELTALADGFSWGFQSGPAHVINTMHLNAAGQWQETTDVTFGTAPPRKSMEMLLDRKP